jgi:hypothetical protein
MYVMVVEAFRYTSEVSARDQVVYDVYHPGFSETMIGRRMAKSDSASTNRLTTE